MFSFISFRRVTRNVFTLLVMLCLSSALFIGCKDEPDPVIPNTGDDQNKLNESLIGTWEDAGEWGTDGYKITANKLEGTWDGDVSYSGTIEYVSNFSNTAGVIIIKYDTNTWNPSSVGKYNGVYYQNLKPGISVEMSTAWADGDEIKNSLDEAKAAFTIGKTGDYIAVFGGPYLKK
jgi:hypothetical protein